MDANDKPILVYSTFPDEPTAEAIGGALVDSGLAACVNILGRMTSIYMWEGKRARDSEVAMLVKTRDSLAETVIEEICRQHPYDNAAVLVLPVAAASEPFADWISAQTRTPGSA